jgi:hypothetical protein
VPRAQDRRACDRGPLARVFVAAALLVSAVACTDPESPTPGETGADRPATGALDSGEPYPFDQPAPPRQATGIDGTYARAITIDQAGGRPVYCRRCAPYRRDAGRSMIVFEEGRFFVRFKPVAPGPLCPECLRPPDFSATGHYSVSDDRLTLFNDPNCPHEEGIYTWSLDGSRLRLQEVDDPCPYDRLRAKFLTATSWHQV